MVIAAQIDNASASQGPEFDFVLMTVLSGALEATAVKILLSIRSYLLLTGRLEQARRKVFQVAAPGLPFVICSGRLIKNVLDLSVVEGRVQSFQSGFHAVRLIGSHADPQ